MGGPAGAEAWISGLVEVAGPVELTHERPWSTVLRVPVAGDIVWFKACGGVQSFEPRLTADLFGRWPDRVTELLASDEDRGWLLMADAGTRIGDLANPPEYWLRILPQYSELQRGEAARADEHLGGGVPDLRVETLPSLYDDLVGPDLPISADDGRALRSFAPRFSELCAELASCGLPSTLQHDDLHMNNVYLKGDRLRILDWGDSSISHPFASLVATFRFLEERNGITEQDPWYARLRDAYLEPWGDSLTGVFELAMRVGTFAHAIAALRQRSVLTGTTRSSFDEDLAVRLRAAVARVD